MYYNNYGNPTSTRTVWIGQPPVLDRHEVVTDNGDVDTLGQATPVVVVLLLRARAARRGAHREPNAGNPVLRAPRLREVPFGSAVRSRGALDHGHKVCLLLQASLVMTSVVCFLISAP